MNHLTQSMDKAIYELVYKQILMEFPFLAPILRQLPPTPWDGSLATDGMALCYNPEETIDLFRHAPNTLTANTLHTLLHGCMGHLFSGKADLENWDLACDISVENILLHLTTWTEEEIPFPRQMEPFFAPDLLSPYDVLALLEKQSHCEEIIQEMKLACHRDDHSLWPGCVSNTTANQDTIKANFVDIPLGGNLKEPDQDAVGIPTAQGLSSNQKTAETQKVPQPGAPNPELPQQWQEIREQVIAAMEAFGMENPSGAPLLQTLKDLNRKQYDYGKFLKTFAQLREETMVNDEEFDYIFYTYGLNRYGNMPLLEPLEYKEVRKIHDFVIAIDTSGSTKGEVVQMFLEKTYDILKNTESFQRSINLHIIQCDTKVQEVVTITDQAAFERYIQNLVIKGGGGTDFRPVFQYVDKLVAEKTFHRLQGILYFTDGMGTFPRKMPAYQTAFVFVLEKDFAKAKVPPWAMKILLTKEEIKGV